MISTSISFGRRARPLSVLLARRLINHWDSEDAEAVAACADSLRSSGASATGEETLATSGNVMMSLGVGSW